MATVFHHPKRKTFYRGSIIPCIQQLFLTLKKHLLGSPGRMGMSSHLWQMREQFLNGELFDTLNEGQILTER